MRLFSIVPSRSLSLPLLTLKYVSVWWSVPANLAFFDFRIFLIFAMFLQLALTSTFFIAMTNKHPVPYVCSLFQNLPLKPPPPKPPPPPEKPPPPNPPPPKPPPPLPPLPPRKIIEAAVIKALSSLDFFSLA